MKDSSPKTPEYTEPFHYRHRAFFVGLFILIPVLLLSSFLLYQLVRVGLLEKWTPLYLYYDNVYNLQKGAAITFRGVKIGRVTDIELSSEGFVEITLKIRTKYFALIEQDCVARLNQKNFPVGDWQITILRAESSTGLVRPGDVIPSIPPLALENVLERVEKLACALDAIGTQIQAGKGLIGRLFSDDTFTLDLDILTTQTHKILKEVDRLLARADHTIGNADEMIEHMDEFGRHGTQTVDALMSVSVNANLLIEQFGELESSMDKLTSEIRELPPDIKEVITGLKRDITEAEILLKGIQNHWLIRNAVKKAQEQAEEK